MRSKENVKNFIADAIADGWECKPRHEGESVESSAELTRDGFIISALNRDGTSRLRADRSISCWGPDSLAVIMPEKYSLEAIVNGVNICSYCGAEGETFRVGFAGRSCASCRPEQERRFMANGGYR